jgi:hypothetical protein
MARHNPIYVNPYRHPEDTGVHVVSREINLGALGLADGEFPIGAAEKNAIPLRAGVRIITAFNAGTTNVLTIGTEADDDAFITSANAALALALASLSLPTRCSMHRSRRRERLPQPAVQSHGWNSSCPARKTPAIRQVCDEGLLHRNIS